MTGNAPFVDDIVLRARDESAAGYASYIKNTKDAKNATDDLGRSAANNVKGHADLSGALDKSGISAGELRRVFRTLGQEANLIGGPLGQLIKDTSVLSVGSLRLSAGITAATLAVAASAAAVYLSVGAYVELEKHQATVNNLLAATKNASGQTADGLNDMAHRLAASGTQSVASIREAQLELLKFKAVAGSSFESTLKLAKDLSASGFGDLKTTVTALAQAFKDPANANQHLAATTLQLSVAEARLAYELANVGRFAESARVVQDGLSKQVAGADAVAADTLGAAWNRVAHSSSEVLEVWGKQIAEGLRLKEVLNGIAAAAERQAKGQGTSFNPLQVFTAPYALGQGLVGKGANALGMQTPQQIEAARVAALPKPTPMMSAGAATSLFGVGGDALHDSIDDYTKFRKGMDEVSEALRRQAVTAGMNAIQQQVYNEAIKVGALGNKQAEGAIRGWVTAIEGARAFRQMTDQIKEQTAASRIEGETVGMTTIAAKEYQTVQEFIARETIKGNAPTAQRIELLKQMAGAQRIVNEATAAAKLNEQLTFDRSQLGRSSTEQLVASQLKSAGIGADSEAGRALASTIRLNDALKDTKEIASEALKSFITDLRAGKSGAEALKGALDKIASKLTDKLIDTGLSAIFKVGLSGLSGGMGGSAVADPFTGGFSLAGSSAAAVKFHNGGKVGYGGAPVHVDSRLFANAPRMHGGGIAGDEVPIIAKRGEVVGWPDQMGGNSTHYEYHIDARGADQAAVMRLERSLHALQETQRQQGRTVTSSVHLQDTGVSMGGG